MVSTSTGDEEERYSDQPFLVSLKTHVAEKPRKNFIYMLCEHVQIAWPSYQTKVTKQKYM